MWQGNALRDQVINQSYGFSAVMRMGDWTYRRGWRHKIGLLEGLAVIGEDSPGVPWAGVQASHSGDQAWSSTGNDQLKLKLRHFRHLRKRAELVARSWYWRTEAERKRQWKGSKIMDGIATDRAWEFRWTSRSCDGQETAGIAVIELQRVGHDLMNWAELNQKYCKCCCCYG